MADDKAREAEERGEATGAPAEAAGEAPSLEQALEAARAEAATFKDQVLRAQAETENVRRRAARTVENAHKYALERFTGEVLPVIDSLEKALESGAEAVEGPARAVIDGVGLSLKLFLDTLAKNGVEQIDPLGEPFNPEYHEAMTMLASETAEPGSVLEVLQKGYTLNGRLVRAAKVVVARAGSAPGADEQA